MFYVIRNYSHGDFIAFKEFYETAFHFKSGIWGDVLNVFDKKIERPNYVPKKDLFIAECNKDIVGFEDVHAEILIERIVLNGFLLSKHRRKKLFQAFLDKAFQRGKEQGACVAHVCVSEEDKTTRGFLLQARFYLARCFLDLESDLSGISGKTYGTDLGEAGHFVKGEERLLAALQNRVFSGSWGFCPNTAEEIAYYLKLTGCKLEDILALRRGDALAGYLWPHFFPMHSQPEQIPRGRIHMYGIAPDFRRKGLGKKLLVLGLFHLKEKGIKKVELTVDRENTLALSLYESIGFREKAKKFWYEKELY